MNKKIRMWDRVILRTPTWEILDSMINNKWVKSSLIWLAITPLAAKAFASVEKIYLPFLSGDIDLALPFSWVYFFFAALSFSLASILFSLFCPRVIKNYKNLGEFRDKDASSGKLMHLVIDSIPKGAIQNDFKEEFNNLMTRWGTFVGAEPSEDEDGAYYYSLGNIISPSIDEAFIGLRMVSNDAYSKIRLVISIFFFIGCALLAKVIWQNIIFVSQQI